MLSATLLPNSKKVPDRFEYTCNIKDNVFIFSKVNIKLFGVRVNKPIIHQRQYLFIHIPILYSLFNQWKIEGMVKMVM